MLGMITSYAKPIAWATGAISLAIAVHQLHSAVYDAGRESMRVEMQQLLIEQDAEHRAEYAVKVQEALDLQSEEHAAELVRARGEVKIKRVVEKVIEYVDRKIIVPASCDEFADTVSRVLVDATRIVASQAGDSTEGEN